MKKLGESNVSSLHLLYENRISGGSDLVTYWFEKARRQLTESHDLRVGLIATQSIRGGVNRRVLEAIKKTGDIFLAWSDRKWPLDGAMVHVSIVCFCKPTNEQKYLDGAAVTNINADLTCLVDVTIAKRLRENDHLCFRADEKGGPFDITNVTAEKLIAMPTNVNGRPNSDVLKPWVNAVDITGRPRNMWIIDFYDMDSSTAAQYEGPFETLKKRIAQEAREEADPENRTKPRKKWWLHRRSGEEMRQAVANLRRFFVTISHGKHRLFVWMNPNVLPSNAMYVFAREDDYFFGVLHSSTHEIWARSTGTQVREAESGFRYTPETCFEKFPFPYPPGTEPSEADSPIVRAIADAVRELVRLRDAWLNPPNASEADLKDRTLTKLYNARAEGKMEWLANAHRTLDHAVFAAYGWPSNLSDQEILARLLALNHERAAAQASDSKI